MDQETFDEAEAQSELRVIIVEQHQGKWIFNGDPNDKKAIELHDEYVQSRIKLGIELTAKLRSISALPTKRGSSKRPAKESIVAAITEDLLS